MHHMGLNRARVLGTGFSLLLVSVLVFSFVLVASPAHATGSFIQQNTCGTGGATSVACAFSGNPAKKDVIVVSIMSATAGKIFNVTDSQSNQYVAYPRYDGASVGDDSWYFVANVTTTATDTITVHVSSSEGFDFTIYEVAGVSSVGFSYGGSGTSSAPSIGSHSFAAGSVEFAILGLSGARTIAAGASWSLDAPLNNPTFYSFEHAALSSPSSFPWSLSGSQAFQDYGLVLSPPPSTTVTDTSTTTTTTTTTTCCATSTTTTTSTSTVYTSTAYTSTAADVGAFSDLLLAFGILGAFIYAGGWINGKQKEIRGK